MKHVLFITTGLTRRSSGTPQKRGAPQLYVRCSYEIGRKDFVRSSVLSCCTLVRICISLPHVPFPAAVRTLDNLFCILRADVDFDGGSPL